MVNAMPPHIDPLSVWFCEKSTAEAAIEKFGDRLKALFVEVPAQKEGDL